MPAMTAPAKGSALGSESSESSQLNCILVGNRCGLSRQKSNASHDSSSCISQGSALGSVSSGSIQLEPALTAQLADDVAPTSGVQDASRNAAEDSINAAEPDAEQPTILADLHLFSRYASLLCCLLYIILHVSCASFHLWPCTGHSCLHLWHMQMTFAWVTIEGTVMHAYPTYCLTEFLVAYRMAARPLVLAQGQKQQAQSNGTELGVILNKVNHSGSYKDVSVVWILQALRQGGSAGYQQHKPVAPSAHLVTK